MTEEIIIDGVNVAGCEFLRKCVIPDNEGCKIDDSLCCDVGNCYYKQLQRLKQENEELKEGYDKRGELMKNAAVQRENYKQALEEIRDNLKNICDRECDFHWCKGSCPDSDCDYYTNINKINEVLK